MNLHLTCGHESSSWIQLGGKRRGFCPTCRKYVRVGPASRQAEHEHEEDHNDERVLALDGRTP